MWKKCPKCQTNFNSSVDHKFYCSEECTKAARLAYTKGAKFKETLKRYKKKPEYKYYVKLWKAGLSVKDIKREKRS